MLLIKITVPEEFSEVHILFHYFSQEQSFYKFFHHFLRFSFFIFQIRAYGLLWPAWIHHFTLVTVFENLQCLQYSRNFDELHKQWLWFRLKFYFQLEIFCFKALPVNQSWQIELLAASVSSGIKLWSEFSWTQRLQILHAHQKQQTHYILCCWLSNFILSEAYLNYTNAILGV